MRLLQRSFESNFLTSASFCGVLKFLQSLTSILDYLLPKVLHKDNLNPMSMQPNCSCLELSLVFVMLTLLLSLIYSKFEVKSSDIVLFNTEKRLKIFISNLVFKDSREVIRELFWEMCQTMLFTLYYLTSSKIHSV